MRIIITETNIMFTEKCKKKYTAKAIIRMNYNQIIPDAAIAETNA